MSSKIFIKRSTIGVRTRCLLRSSVDFGIHRRLSISHHQYCKLIWHEARLFSTTATTTFFVNANSCTSTTGSTLFNNTLLLPQRYFSSNTTETQSTTTTKNEQQETITIDNEQIPIIDEEKENKKLNDVDISQFTVEVPIRMPDIGNGKGKVVKWYKKEGDIVKWEDILCDIETEDFTFGMELDDEELGVMGTILVAAPSDTIKANDVICFILHKPEETKQPVEQKESSENNTTTTTTKDPYKEA